MQVTKKKEKKITKNLIEQEEQYVQFLEKRVASENFKNNVSEEEYKDTVKKLKKAKDKLKLMKNIM